MKLHGAKQLGSTSVLLNNIVKYVKRGKIRPFSTLTKDLLSNSSKPVFWQFISTLPGQLYAKIEKCYWIVLEQMASKCKKCQIWPFWPWQMTFRAIQPNLSFNILKKLHAKKKKLLKRFWDWPLPPPPRPLNLDGQTDRRTTDNSSLEKLRCLSAGGAKAPLPFGWRS